jgi:hypothetical protein
MKKIRIIGEDIASILKNHLEFEYQGKLSNEAISILVNTFSKKIHLSESEKLEMWATLSEMDDPLTISLDKNLKSDFFGTIEKWIAFEKRRKKEFERAIQSIEHLVKSKKYIVPIHWDRFYYGEFLNTYGLEINKINAYALKSLPRITGNEILNLLEQADGGLSDIQELDKINIIAHKLKILHVSGILDAVDKIFCDRYYKSNKVIESQKAMFLAQIMGIPDQAQQVWNVLRKEEYHTGPALNAAKNLFKDTGVEKYLVEKKLYNS